MGQHEKDKALQSIMGRVLRFGILLKELCSRECLHSAISEAMREKDYKDRDTRAPKRPECLDEIMTLIDTRPLKKYEIARRRAVMRMRERLL